MDPLLLDGSSLTLDDVEDVCVHHRPVALHPDAAAAVDRSRAVVESILERGETVYGVNTGFGHLAQVRVPPADLATLQTNLVRSHAVGVGAPFDVPTTRGIMLLRANVLAAGHSGVRRSVLNRLLLLINEDIHPWIPSQGSVGASGDLAPLAHLALVLLNEGLVHGESGPIAAGPVLSELGLAAIQLAPKEGLALINGTQAMTALGALVVSRARRLAKTADVIGAMTVEAKLGSHRPFDERLHALRPHPGQLACASNLRRLLQGGNTAESHAECDKVQDAYSLRCMPQVHGAGRSAIDHAASVVGIEINAVTDNPTVFVDEDELLSGGNFHGQPIACVLDYLAIGVAELGSIAERRIEQLVNPRLSQLPAFLAEQPGLHSGFMMAQVTAAALASENKSLAHPASVDSIPTSANQEDHVSMGPIAARQALATLENVERILAIELLVAGQALDLRAPLVPADGPRAALEVLRKTVPHLDADRLLAIDIEHAGALVRGAAVLKAAEEVVGPLD